MSPLLHSFPTRRSSDLLLARARVHLWVALAVLIAAPVLMHAGNPFKDLTSTAGGFSTWDADLIDVETVAQTGSGVYVDRKSTRLNSSHLGISYAVFCLK